MEEISQDSVASPTGTGPAKSKLDTLSKDDLIKFAKKQMTLLQKVKSKCSDLEKEVELLKAKPVNGTNDTVLKELTERMEAVLLEKAEIQQSLVLLRKEKEKAKRHEQDALDQIKELQKQCNQTNKDHLKQIEDLKKELETSQAKQQEEIKSFQKLLKEKSAKEHNDDVKVSEIKAHYEKMLQLYKDQLSTAQRQVEVANQERQTEAEQLQKAHKTALLESRKELENIQEEIQIMKMAHEKELGEMIAQMDAAASDFEMERERLLLLQDELTEQLELKESYLHDVKEEDEESGRSGHHPLLRTSGQLGSDELQDEMAQLRMAFEDMQSQNAMLQEELTYLSNVKVELESDLVQVKEEFQIEKEEMEFKINELQMCREDGKEMSPEKLLLFSENGEMAVRQIDELMSLKELHIKNLAEFEKSQLEDNETEIKNLHEVPKLRDMCKELITQKLETELIERTGISVNQYNAMKEEGAAAIDNVEQTLQAVSLERSGRLEQSNNLNASLQCQQYVCEFRASFTALQERNEQILSILHQKETVVQELEETVLVLKAKKEEAQSFLKDIKAEMENLREELAEERIKTTRLDLNLQNLSQSSAKIQQKLDESALSLVAALEEKERLEHLLNTLEGKLTEVCSEKDQQALEIHALTEEMNKHREDQESLQEINSLKLIFANEMNELQEQLQSACIERNDLKKEFEMKQTQLSEVRSHICSLLHEGKSQNEIDSKDILLLVEDLLTQERLNLLQQSEAEAAHKSLELVGVQEQNAQQHAQLEDMTRERSLLKNCLDDVVADMEALQRDLAEMKAANEKICMENRQLLTQIDEAAQKLQAKESERISDENSSVAKVEDFLRQLAEKDTFLSQLQEEVALLKESKDTCTESEEQREVAKLSTQIAGLQKENMDKDGKINKIKAVAVKAKKELDSSKKEVHTLRAEIESLKGERDRMSSSLKEVIQGAEGYKNLLAEYDKQTEQLDQERGKLEEAERQIADLTKSLQASFLQNEHLTSEREDLMARLDTLQSNVRQLEAQALEMQKVKSSLHKDLEAEKLLKEQKTNEHVAAVKEMEELKTHLQRQKQQLQQTAQELEQLRKEAQQSTLMDMEMAHYERLVKELNQKVLDKDTVIEELKAEIDTQNKTKEQLHEEIASLKAEVQQADEKTCKIKQLLVKAKKDLAEAKKEVVAHMSSQASLKGELETQQQQLEEYKIQCSDLTAQRHKLQEQLKASAEQQQRAALSFQQRLNSLQEECDTAKVDLASTTSEFEGYKVRVHNVLKQKKSKSSSHMDSDINKQEREQMEAVLEQLRSRLHDSQQNLQANCTELQQLQAEHDALLERHNKILQENVVKEAELRERMLSLQSEHMALKTEHTQTVSQLTAQSDSLRTTFREQMRHMQEEHRSTVDTLQQQIGRLEGQLFQQQREHSITSPMPAQQARKTLHDRRPVELALADMQGMAREEGEGMETTESESVSSAGTPLPSLEQLLTSPDPKQEPFVWQVEPSKEDLVQRLNTATRSMDHMNSLLHDTEATNAILMEQITLLKSEVRRLERNQEREKSVANLEYLKNVLLQFIFLKCGSERQALLPVINTMLQLSPEEKNKLAAIAHGEEEAAAGSRASGWTSYLHSWSGIR